MAPAATPAGFRPQQTCRISLPPQRVGTSPCGSHPVRFALRLTGLEAPHIIIERAGIAQLVEYKLPKLGVAGSNPVARSKICPQSSLSEVDAAQLARPRICSYFG